MTSGISFGGGGHLACVQCGLKKKKKKKKKKKEKKEKEEKYMKDFYIFLSRHCSLFFPFAALDKNRVVSRSANPAVDHDSGSFRQ